MGFVWTGLQTTRRRSDPWIRLSSLICEIVFSASTIANSRRENRDDEKFSKYQRIPWKRKHISRPTNMRNKRPRSPFKLFISRNFDTQWMFITFVFRALAFRATGFSHPAIFAQHEINLRFSCSRRMKLMARENGRFIEKVLQVFFWNGGSEEIENYESLLES